MTDIFAARSAQPMLIGLSGEAFDSPDYVFELKLDGERCLAYLDAEETVLINRRGRLVGSQFPELADLHRRVRGRCILDGELITGSGDKADFEVIKQRAATRHPHAIRRLAAESPATFVAVDILYRDADQITALPLIRRQEILASMVREDQHLALSRVVAEHGVAFFNTVRERGLEGIIAKRRDSVYQMGKRTREWMKIKNWVEDDFVVCGYVENPGAAVTSLVLGQYGRDGLMVYKGRVTLGLQRDDFAAVARLPRADSPFREKLPAGSADAVWVAPRLVCRVGFMCWTVTGKLRQPFYKHLVRGANARMITEPAERDKGMSCARDSQQQPAGAPLPA